MIGLETDGGGDYNHKHVYNQLDLFGLFILGNMDKLNVTHGCPGLSFLNTGEKPMSLLHIGLS